MSHRRIIVIGAVGLAGALALLAENGIAVHTDDDVSVVAKRDDIDLLTLAALTHRTPLAPANIEPCISRDIEWVSESCPPHLQRALPTRRAQRPTRVPSGYG